MKIKIGILVFFSLFTTICFAQQRPHYTQNILNNYILNPALTGIENYFDLKLSSRYQWVGIKGAPTTYYLSIHGPLGKKDYNTTATSFEMPGVNPRGDSYWKDYTAAQPHHGIGAIMLYDQTGSYTWLTADLSYAYHIGLSPRANLAAGFSAGITKVSIDRSKVDFGTTNPIDPSLNNALKSKIFQVRPDLNVGLWLYSRDYFVGFAAMQVLTQDLVFVDNNKATTKGKMVPHLFGTFGYRFLLNEDFNLLPSVMVKYVQSNSIRQYQFETNFKLMYQDKFWTGVSYRVEDGVAAMVGVNVDNLFNISYSYDYTTSPLRAASKGTHELIIGFLLGNRYNDSCPRANW